MRARPRRTDFGRRFHGGREPVKVWSGVEEDAAWRWLPLDHVTPPAALFASLEEKRSRFFESMGVAFLSGRRPGKTELASGLYSAAQLLAFAGDATATPKTEERETPPQRKDEA